VRSRRGPGRSGLGVADATAILPISPGLLAPAVSANASVGLSGTESTSIDAPIRGRFGICGRRVCCPHLADLSRPMARHAFAFSPHLLASSLMAGESPARRSGHTNGAAGARSPVGGRTAGSTGDARAASRYCG
jgi:hypothetical protein